MATVLITGPSGVGKDWVAERIKESNPNLNFISIDDFFEYIKDQDFTDPALRTSDHTCIRKNYHLVDFSKRFAEALSIQAFDRSCDTVVQGYQLPIPIVRQALFDLIGLDPKTSLLLGIYPSPQRLLKNRRGSTKTFHREHANIQDCTEMLHWHEPLFNKYLTSFSHRKCASSEEALKLANNFFTHPFNRDLVQIRP